MEQKSQSKHPGVVLYEEFIKPEGVNIAELSVMFDYPLKGLQDFIDGKIPLSKTIARKLARKFGTSLQYWEVLQDEYNKSHRIGYVPHTIEPENRNDDLDDILEKIKDIQEYQARLYVLIEENRYEILRTKDKIENKKWDLGSYIDKVDLRMLLNITIGVIIGNLAYYFFNMWK